MPGMTESADQSAIPTGDPFTTFAAWFAEAQGADMKLAKSTFVFSIFYLFALFAALVADAAIYGQGAFS